MAFTADRVEGALFRLGAMEKLCAAVFVDSVAGSTSRSFRFRVAGAERGTHSAANIRGEFKTVANLGKFATIVRSGAGLNA
jgi:hypothetical protein